MGTGTEGPSSAVNSIAKEMAARMVPVLPIMIGVPDVTGAASGSVSTWHTCPIGSTGSPVHPWFWKDSGPSLVAVNPLHSIKLHLPGERNKVNANGDH